MSADVAAKWKKVGFNLLVIAVFILLSFGLPLLRSLLSNIDPSIDNKADGFNINSYKVIMNVKENNIVEVTEEITVDWLEMEHHGIYKFTPEWLEYTAGDGKTVKRKAIVTNYRAVGEEYTVDVVNGKKKIKIGSPDMVLPPGLHDYTIKYNYDMGNDPYQGFDEFIFHAFGDYWGTQINNASLEIHMPKNFDSSKITFWADKYRKKEITSSIDYYVDDNNVLYANVSSSYNLSKALTVDIPLEEGYFASGSNNYGYYSLLLCLGIIGLAVFSYFTWNKYGKNHAKKPRTVEFYPPEDYDAAQIGYIYGKETSDKLTIALIVQLASKGYIKINESEDKQTRTIINLFPNPVKGIDGYAKAERRTIVVSKIKDADNSLTAEETTWMKYLFGNGDSKEIVSGFDDFYKNVDRLINTYIKIESDTTTNNSGENIEAVYAEIKEKKAKLKPLTEAERIVYDKLFETSDTNILKEDKTFYTVFNMVGTSLKNSLEDKIREKKSYRKMILNIMFSIVSIILYYLAWWVYEDLNPAFGILYNIAFISLLAIILFTIFMGRKTEYGESISARVLGFKNYMELAEKAQLEAQVQQNPHYFYDILPYAYALNVSKKWIDKFENIPLPPSDMGNFNYFDMVAFSSLSDSVYLPPSSSSGGSSGGGGGGGCGGCGGGGSW